MDMRRAITTGLLVLCVMSAGCWGKAGGNRLSQPAGHTMAANSSPAPFGDPRYQNLMREVENKGGTATFPSESASPTESIKRAVSSASAAVAGALTPKPKVVKAADPVALDSMPKKIDADLYYQAGRLAESNGNDAAAVKQYGRALKQDPNHVPTLIGLARLHDRNERFDEAEKLYRRAIEAQPDNAITHNDYGLCLARQRRHDAAVAALSRATQLEPSRHLYHNNLATVYVEMGRHDEAGEVLHRVHPQGVAHYNLGYLLYRDGKTAEARRQFTLAVRHDPSLSAAQDMLAQLDPTAASQAAKVARAPAGAPQTTTTPAVEPQKFRVEATPATLSTPPTSLRRTPAVGSVYDEDDEVIQPAVQLQAPVLQTDHAAANAVSPQVAKNESLEQIQFPMRRLTASRTDRPVHDIELPTPRLISD